MKGYLSQKGIVYTERNVAQDAEARQTVLDMGHCTTPVTLIGDHKVVGYDERELDAALSAAGVV